MTYRSPWPVIIQVAAAFAMAMGIGRFVYTPILPMMTSQTDLSASGSALLATMNYAGYLIGAAAGIVLTRLLRSRTVMRWSLAANVIAVSLMPVTHSEFVWSALRLTSGVASAITFMAGVAALMYHLGPIHAHLMGWGLAGVGIGIALSGAMVLAIRAVASWQTAWYASGVLAALLAAVAWNLLPEKPAAPAAEHAGSKRPRTTPWFAALLISYSLEGVGYIIAGTFLVAAIDQNAAPWVGSSAWILVGISSSVATIIWVAMTRRYRRVNIMTAALVVQLVGVTLPAVSSTATAAMVAALMFGGTFVPIAILAISIGSELQFPRAVAILTFGYSIGQILGPLIVSPLLKEGYQTALWVGAGFVAASLLAALALRIRYPQPVAESLTA